MDFTLPAIAIALLGLWAVRLLQRDSWVVPTPSRGSIKFTHLLPAILQVILFAYWSIYWTGVRDHVASLGAQIAFAYAFDFLLHWHLRRSFTPGLGPVPI